MLIFTANHYFHSNLQDVSSCADESSNFVLSLQLGGGRASMESAEALRPLCMNSNNV